MNNQTQVAVKPGNLQHGHTRGNKPTPEYRCWTSMMQRCYYAKARGYENYGGRGIAVCDRWRNSFEAFLADMGPRPSLEYSVERKDSKGNYEPDNCRWATAKEQQRNRSSNLQITYRGKTQTGADWADELGMNRHLIYSRLKRGWSLDLVMNPTPFKSYEILKRK